jgi:hypothetical protein
MQSGATMFRTDSPFRTAMPKHARASSTYYVTVCMTLVAICTLAVFAQSGRRVRKSAAMPLPTPEATPLPTPVEKPKPAFTFIVGLDSFGDFSNVSLNAFSGVLRSCVGRLNDSPSVRAQVATRSLSRGEAIKMAKAEKESYIVFLELRSEGFSGGTDINRNSNNVFIQYSVLAPITAKTATQGHTYPDAYRNRGINLPSSTSTGDYYLNQAARGAAERILKHFHVPVRRWLTADKNSKRAIRVNREPSMEE